MSAYNPPTRDSVIFNPEYFQTSLADLDTTYLNQNYLRFPFAQGTENLQAINVNGDAVFNSDLRLNQLEIHLGTDAGLTNQGYNSIAIGNTAGKTTQGSDAVAIGSNSGETTQGLDAVAIGSNSGQTTQGLEATALGHNAGNNNQGAQAVAIGKFAGNTNRGTKSVAIGNDAGYTGQLANAIAIGVEAGKTTQGTNSIAIGDSAGILNQGASSIAIGEDAGGSSLGSNSIAIGKNSAGTGIDSISIGFGANTSTFTTSVAIGKGATSTANNQITLGTATESVRVLGGTTATGLITANGGLTMGMSNNITLGTGATAATSTQLGYTVNPTLTTISSTIATGTLTKSYYSFTLPAGTWITTFKVVVIPSLNTATNAYLSVLLSPSVDTFTGGFGNQVFGLQPSAAFQTIILSTPYFNSTSKTIYLTISNVANNGNITFNASTQCSIIRIA
jgi:hypothetical protein